MKKTSEHLPNDYLERVNRAIDYIVGNLSGDLKLENVARAACFSPFHFHRIFQSLVGETLNQFVKRQRLERALYLMSHAPQRSLTDIALDCGFSSSSDFSRNFKLRFGVPPSAFNLKTFRDSRRDEFNAVIADQEGAAQLPRLPAGSNPDNFEVTIRELPQRTVAYIRVFDPYQATAVPEACERLLNWAKQRNLAGGQWLGYMWEDPEIVAMKDCRYDVAVVVDDVKPDGEIGRFVFPPMRVAELELRGNIELEQRGIDWMFGTWLPDSGFAPADQPCFEAWHGQPFAHGMEHFELSMHLPITNLI
ncbi:MAG: AraC family transcriptional regulator [Planctomycetota bacterium]|jgi:AraC family transcriptional regulator